MRTVAALCRELLPDRRTDGALLAAFVSERDEATFLELVRRHGPLVWGVCRRALPDPADAEDAFQATFLVLVSQAAKLSTRDTVGPWLHRVAVWTSRNVWRKNARRLARQRELPEVPVSAPDSDLKADIDGALLSLPARYREPIILCHLQGFTRREAAERLGCAEGTLSAWLDRGLAKLRVRLRALDPAQALAVGAVAVPAALMANTARAAVASGVASTVPPAVSSLVEGVLHMLWIKKATAAAFALCAVFVVGVGVGLGTRTQSVGVVAQEKGAADPRPRPLAAPDRAKEIEDAEVEVMKLKAQQIFNEARLQDAKDKLAKLKADKPAPAGDKETALLKLDELKAQLAKIETERARLLLEADTTKRQLEVAEDRIRALQQAAEQLAAQAERDKKAGVPVGWHIEITVRGKGDEFVIQEKPDDPRRSDRPGAVRTDDTWALALLLRRAKADTNGPREVRVVVEPQAALSSSAARALKACDEAGFKTVTFTGYVFGGGFAVQLKPDQKGDVRGYKRYDKAEVKPKELAAEIEEGLKRF